ncbi:MAG: TolC family protein [Bacteroidia bacterium]
MFKIKSMRSIYFLNLIVLLLGSCAIPKENSLNQQIQLPESYYLNSNDTLQVPLKTWREYFKDPYLQNLIDSAISNNIELQIINQRLYAARAEYIMNRNYMYPSVNTFVSSGLTRFGDYTIDGVGNFDTNKSPNINEKQKIPNPIPDYFVGLNTNWEINTVGKLRNNKRASFYRFLANKEGKHFLTTQIVAEVARLYYELLALDTELEIIRRNIFIQERALEIVAIQKQSGRINEAGVKQFYAQLLNFKSLEADKIQEINATENILNNLVGRFPQKILRKDTIDVKDLPALLNIGVPVHLLQNRPDIKEAEKNLKAKSYELKSAKAAFYPNILINANYGLNAFKNELLFSTPNSLAYGLIAGITTPLINRNQIKGNFRMAQANQSIAFLNLKQAILKGVEEVNSEYVKLEQYRNISNLKNQEVATLRQAVQISNELFLTGYANYMEVLVSRQNRLNAELQLTEANKNQFFAAIQLYKVLGGGWQ